MSSHLTYRPDVDGLRAVAVLGVVFYHAGLGFPGGYIGVDVFFVISGFLITSLILKDLRQGTFSLLDFWERRARRILPALTVVVAAILVAGWFLLLPSVYEVLGKQVIALVALSSNIKFWKETGYFAAAAEEKPLLHTWSLSLEEQFYLIIPLLLLLLYRFRKPSWVAPVLVGGAIASFLLAIYGSHRAPAATFFLLPMRAWELGVGSLLAFASPIGSAALRTALAWLGLAGILVPCVLYTPGIRFPGLTALPPVAGAALLIWSGMQGSSAVRPSFPQRFLASRLMVWFGLISYSLYLWHWPLFAFTKYIRTSPAPISLRLALVAISVVLASISLRYIERPFRTRNLLRTQHQVFVAGSAAVVALMLFSLILWFFAGFPNRLPKEAQLFASGKDDVAFIHRLALDDIPDNLIPFGTVSANPAVFVWGDSHAMAIMPAVDIACKGAGVAGLAATTDATAPTIEWHHDFPYGLNENAPSYNRAVMDTIKDSARAGGIRTVIMAARWSSYLGVYSTQPSFAESLERTIEELDAAGCKVILLQEVPSFPFDVPKTLALHAFWRNDLTRFSVTKNDYDWQSHAQSELFSKIAEKFDNVVVINPWNFLAANNNLFFPADHHGSLYQDSHHLSVHGSMRLKPAIESILIDTIAAYRSSR